MNTFTNIQTMWSELEPERRRLLSGSIGIALFAILVVGAWSSQTQWSTLQHGSSDTLGELAGVLQEAGIEARISMDNALEVPASQRAKALAAINQSSNPTSINPLEHVLGPPKMHDWAMVRAAETQIAQTLNRFDGINASRVLLVPEDQALFADEAKPASASVFLKLRPGVAMDDAQVVAVVNTVVHSMRGLTPEHISVVDHRGSVLHRGGGKQDAVSDEANHLMDLAMVHQTRIEESISKALHPVLGFDGTFSVAASVELDTTTTETRSRRVDPETRVAISETLEENNSENVEPGGVPGVDAHLPERPAASTGSRKQESTTERFDYDVSEVADHVLRPSGAIRRIAVAVQIDAARVAMIADQASIAPKQVEAQIRDIVRSAAGIDSERMDEVVVTSLPFAQQQYVAASVAPAADISSDEVLAYGPYAVALLALFLTFWFVVRPMMKTALPSAQQMAMRNSRATPGDETSSDLATRLKRLVDNYQPVDANDLNRLVNEQSQASAAVLRRWNTN